MANPPPPRMPPPPKQPMAPWRVKAGKATPWVAVLLLLVYPVQVWFAAVGLIAGFPEHLEYHVFLGRMMELLPLLLVLLGVAARQRRTALVGVILVVQMFLQSILIFSSNGYANGLHAVNGLLMFGLTLWLVLQLKPWAKSA